MKILIAEDDPVSSKLLAANLTKWGHEVVLTQNGLDAWEVLQKDDAPMFAILDWMMPGMNGVEVCRKVRQEITDSPVYLILLTAMRRKEDVIEGLEAGADDYLTKPFDRHELRVRVNAGARIIALQTSLHQRVKELEEAIIERERAEDALRSLTLTDDMTGLYNHRGFFTLAEHHTKIARRARQDFLLIYADMDGLKEINDTLGHAIGSLAIAKTAEILRLTFRDCDIIARLGGDEFAILAPNVPAEESEGMIQRLRDNLQAFSQEYDSQFRLSLSIGAVRIDHNSDLTIVEQVANADKAMYEDKRRRKVNVGFTDKRKLIQNPLPSSLVTAKSHL